MLLFYEAIYARAGWSEKVLQFTGLIEPQDKSTAPSLDHYLGILTTYLIPLLGWKIGEGLGEENKQGREEGLNRKRAPHLFAVK